VVSSSVVVRSEFIANVFDNNIIIKIECLTTTATIQLKYNNNILCLDSEKGF